MWYPNWWKLDISTYAKQRPRSSSGSFVATKKVYDWLLDFESVRSWIDSYPAEMTRRNYLTGLNIVCQRLKLDPDQILRLGIDNGDKVPRDLKTRIKGLLNEYVQSEKLGEARKIVASLRSFLASHEVAIVFTRQERIRYRRKKVVGEKVPTKQDVYVLVDAVENVKGWRDPLKKLRAKALILCAFQSGVRPSCLVRWRFCDVKDSLFPQIKAPVPLKITPQLDSKLEGHDLPYYYTFLSIEAAQALKDYLEARMNRGARLADESPVFVTHGNNSRDSRLSYGNYFAILKRVASVAGLQPSQIWPHLLRKTFKKVLNKAEIDDDTREALMGHRIPGSRENYFDRHDLADVAARYSQCDFSNTTKQLEEQEDKMLEMDQRIAELEGMLQDLIQGSYQGIPIVNGEKLRELQKQMPPQKPLVAEAVETFNKQHKSRKT